MHLLPFEREPNDRRSPICVKEIFLGCCNGPTLPIAEREESYRARVERVVWNFRDNSKAYHSIWRGVKESSLTGCWQSSRLDEAGAARTSERQVIEPTVFKSPLLPSHYLHPLPSY